jgi:hypothetical protein
VTFILVQLVQLIGQSFHFIPPNKETCSILTSFLSLQSAYCCFQNIKVYFGLVLEAGFPAIIVVKFKDKLAGGAYQFEAWWL